ncbi:unnamed protein product [Adineta ricciae]|uniref:Histone-lysine N-methyltransferase, H3 lysine-79 specific n=1 Tax=Adineta ricciae TaxID=249248 RepID=A0A814BYR9_ADIRI|nr:unnamed protein product [Adineta ricciae]CAF0934374.1 unnamed protein product [Adineta ricciae]
MNSNTVRELKLHSPAGVEPAVFTWPNVEQQKTKKDAIFIGGDEIVRTIRLVFEDYPELYQQNLNLDYCDIHSYVKMKELCDKFNKIIDTHVKLNRGTEAFSARLQQRATAKLFRHILAQVYSRAVTDPDKLRDYEPFSPSVYGETSPDLIDSILKVINLTEEQTFIDLGSGVGNVVLHVAALSNCKHVYGIEHEETPATYACAMADEFRFWMRWYGKCYSEFSLERGDFLSHPKIDELIREVDVVFANNYVFGSTVNHGLKVKFMNMKDGAKIVSSREFCPETFRLNDRTKNDLGAVMHVSKPEKLFGKVSWSDKSVQYYLHVIDHSKLALYYEKAHQLHTKGPKTNHSKQHHHVDDCSPTSPSLTLKMNRVKKSPKIDENHPPSCHIKRKRKSTSSVPSTSTSTSSTTISARGRKIRIKHQSDQESEQDSDGLNDELLNPKHCRTSSKDYQSTLNELHVASKKFIQSSPHFPIKNQQFNYQNMTKLSDENLRLNHLRDCLVEQEDQRFINAINSYLEQFRQRLFTYFVYMKSDNYREHLRKQLDNEMELNQTLKSKVNCLENNIKALLEDAIRLLKLRTNELGIDDLERPIQLISYASDISNKHKELRSKVSSLEKEIAEYDYENEKINSILSSLQTNERSSATASNNNTYSQLFVNASQQHSKKQSQHPEYSIITPLSPNAAKEKNVEGNSRSYSNSTSAYNIVKEERKTDFIIQKRAKKSPNPDGQTTVSPIKIIKVTDKRSSLSDTLPSSPLPQLSSSSSSVTSNMAGSIDNLLSTKQLEPVQVHSVASKTGTQTKQDNTLSSVFVQSVTMQTLLEPLSSKHDDANQDLTLQSPRKKRDFYGKTPGTPTSSSPNRTKSTSPDKARPSSTPPCANSFSNKTSKLPNRPVSIPPLQTSS